MDFIFMLTRQDRTVADALDVLSLIKPLGLKHIGFKDIGVDAGTLGALTAEIRWSGATSYLEVVSTSPETMVASARMAAQLGVDCLLGGTEVDGILAALAGSKVQYFPFPGTPIGHPTKLGGKPEEIEAQCRAFMAKGCAGADILAYRATEADPLDLVRAARQGLGDGRLIVAGSIDGRPKIRAVAEAGADGFTIGSAVFDGSYAPQMGSILSQLRTVLADLG
jgi:hypothetical protein